MTNAKKTVLIIEDSPTQVLSLRLLLEAQGVNVIDTHYGERGVEMAKEYVPDAIVLDIEMPGMNGFEVSAQLSKDPETTHIPIIMLTAQDNAHALRKGLILGAVDFIPKDVFADAVLSETLYQLGIIEHSSLAIPGVSYDAN